MYDFVFEIWVEKAARYKFDLINYYFNFNLIDKWLAIIKGNKK